LLNIAANEQKQFEALCDAVGKSHLKTDGRFADRQDRKKHRFALKEALEEALMKETAEYWEEVLNTESVPCGRVLTIPQVLDHAQAKARDIVKRFDNVPGADHASSSTRPGFQVDGAPLDVAAPPPRLGEHTDEVLKHAGFSAEEIAKLREERVL
jgi:formyl-CoA transferase